MITPIAARGIFEAIYWRPGMRWWVNRIEVLNPIRFEAMRDPQTNRQILALADVAYAIEARFETSDPASAPMYTKMFRQRARQRRYFREPYLGLTIFPANVALSDVDEPQGRRAGPSCDLGWMAHDLAPGDEEVLRFFRASMIGGVITVPPHDDASLAS